GKPGRVDGTILQVEDNFGTVLSYARTLEAAVENVREMFIDNALDDTFTVEVINVIPNNPTMLTMADFDNDREVKS
ncbi:hypothetical protein LCGC14_3063850, partial [marine sediment metagenome]